MRVQIHDLNSDGRGRAFVAGRAVLACQALPGETIDLQVDRSSSTTVQGRPLRWVEESKTVRHRCPHVGKCTGCPLLRAPMQLEDDFKLDRIRKFVGNLWADVVQPVVRPSGAFGYRHYAKWVAGDDRGRLVLGSYVNSSHELADNQGCPVLAPKLSAVLAEIRDRLDGVECHSVISGRSLNSGTTLGLRYVLARLSRATGELIVVLVTSGGIDELRERTAGIQHSVYGLQNCSEGNALLPADGNPIHLRGEAWIEDTLVGYSHRIGPTSFFQINPLAAERMFSHVLNAVGTGQHCVEGYCGVGVLTLPLLERFARVSANELNAESVAALQQRATSELTVECGSADPVLVRMLLQGSPDAVVLDPPRRGLGATVAGAVRDCGAKTVVLLSCDPKSLATDLPVLSQAYAVESITPFDQFPRTAHCETVSVLRRRGD